MLNERWYSVLSDLFVNLAAAWLGIILIGLTLSEISSLIDIILLLNNAVFGIISLFLAYKLRITYE